MIEELINFDTEHKTGFDFVIGTDEAGRGRAQALFSPQQ